MPTKLIKLDDGILVEVEVLDGHVQQISGGFAEKVKSSFAIIEPILVTICKPITSAWQQIEREIEVEKATVEIGLSFEAEGNIFVTKSVATANLKLTIDMKPKQAPTILQ